MYAVIESGGKQYRVAIGDRLRVESLAAEPGQTIDLDKVLLISSSDKTEIGAPAADTKVEATVLGHGRGPKVRIFKLRRRQNSRNRAGHRQNYTELQITSIAGVTEPAERTTAKKASKKKPAGKKSAKKTAAKKAAGKKTSAKKTASGAKAGKKTSKKKTG